MPACLVCFGLPLRASYHGKLGLFSGMSVLQDAVVTYVIKVPINFVSFLFHYFTTKI